MNAPFALRRAAAPAGAAVALCAGVVALATWPAFTVVALAVAGVAALARTDPPAAFVAALGLFWLEGSVKILLTLGGSPVPRTPEAVGAALLDAALLIALAAVLTADRGATPRALWARAGRGERVVLGALAGWLVLSVVQLPLGGDLGRSLNGLRLTHFYVLCAVAGAVVFAPGAAARRAVGPLLGVIAVIAGYAALRVVVGVSDVERSFAFSKDTVVVFGHNFRAIGTFSGAVGLESFLTPAVAFGVVVGALVRRWRGLAWAGAALGIVGEVGSYGRTPLVAIAAGLIGAAALVVLGRDVSPRRKLAVGAAVAAVLAAGAVGTVVAASSSDTLRERARGLVDPGRDRSLHLRTATWRHALDGVPHHPLGQGLGSVGRASGLGAAQVTTDNSFLKVLVEQGIPGALLFVVAVLGAVAVVGRRALRMTGEARALAVAAIAGFASFLGLFITTDDIEQPGKVLAWALLGMALTQALGRPAPGGAEQ